MELLRLVWRGGSIAFKDMEDTAVELVELSPIDIEIIDHYFLNGYNKTQAYLTAHPGCKYDSARTLAARLFADVRIKAEVERRLEEKHMSAEEAIERISDIARGDVSQLMDVSSVGFNLDMAKAKEAGLTKLIKKVRQKTTTYLAKSESQEDREVTELEIELYNAHDAARDILKIRDKFGSNSRRENAGVLPPGTIAAQPAALVELVALLERDRQAAIDQARAIDTTTRSE